MKPLAEKVQSLFMKYLEELWVEAQKVERHYNYKRFNEAVARLKKRIIFLHDFLHSQDKAAPFWLMKEIDEIMGDFK